MPKSDGLVREPEPVRVMFVRPEKDYDPAITRDVGVLAEPGGSQGSCRLFRCAASLLTASSCLSSAHVAAS